MTQQEWLSSNDPGELFDFLWYQWSGRNLSPRKLRLFAVACCRTAQVADVTESLALTTKLAVAERYADGEATVEEVRRVWPVRCAGFETISATWPETARDWAGSYFACEVNPTVSKKVSFLRCLFANPFQPVVLDPSWLTSTVVALAKGIYDENSFDRMPILSDALQDAGCDEPSVLVHCQCEGMHVRGCWLIDALLGKA